MTRQVRRLEEKLVKDVVCCQFYSTFKVNRLPKKFLKDLETSNRRTCNLRCEICSVTWHASKTN
jgi:hypothetical protein